MSTEKRAELSREFERIEEELSRELFDLEISEPSRIEERIGRLEKISEELGRLELEEASR